MISEAEFTKDTPSTTSVSRLWRYKWLMVALAILGGSIGYYRFLQERPLFESSARIRVHWKNLPASLPGADQARAQQELPSHRYLILSPVLIEQAVLKGQLATLPFLKEAQDPVATILRSLQVRDAGVMSRDARQGEIIDLTFSSYSQEACPQVLNYVLEAYITYLTDSQKKNGDEMVQLITRAKDELLTDLSRLQGEYNKYLDGTALLSNGSESINIHHQRLTNIEAERAKLLLHVSQLKSQKESLEAAIKRGVGREALMMAVGRESEREAASQPARPDKDRSQTGSMARDLLPLLVELELIQEKLGSAHPDVKALRTRIDATRNYYATLAGVDSENNPRSSPRDFLSEYVTSIDESITIVMAKISDLNSLFESELLSSRALRSEEAKGESLRSQIAQSKQLFESCVSKLDGYSLSDGFNPLVVDILSPPSRAAVSIANRNQFICAGALVGLFAATLIAYLLELRDKNFESMTKVQDLLGAQILGHIPQLRLGAGKKDRKSRQSDHLSPELVMGSREYSIGKEAYRSIRAALLPAVQGDGCQIIQITSPEAGDGKSMTITNLAIALAGSQQRVLLVDADLRRPRVHKLLAMEREDGLSDVLAGTLDPALCIRDSSIPNLSVVTAGKLVSHPAELLASQKFDDLLDIFRQKGFDLILIDTPPLLAVSDPVSVAARVDAVVLVFRLGQRARDITMHAVSLLRQVQATIAGLVVNRVAFDSKGGGTGYRSGRYDSGNYYYYNSYRHYGPHPEGSDQDSVGELIVRRHRDHTDLSPED